MSLPPAHSGADALPTPGDDAAIDAYLDGTLDAAALTAFEARLRAEPSLAAEVALQGRADESIRRQFAPPAIMANGEVIGAIGPSVAPARSGRPRIISPPMAAAAGIVIAGAVGYWAIVGSPFGPPAPHLTAPAVYQKVVAGGFEPQWVCRDEAEFIAYTRDQFGTSWVVPADPGLRLVGWRSGSDLLGPEAGLLLAERAGRKIVVAIDRASGDRKVRAGEGLNVFRGRLGGLVMYEISPLDAPVIVGRAMAR